MAGYFLDFTPRTLRQLSSIEISKHLWSDPSIKYFLISKLKEIAPHAPGTADKPQFLIHQSKFRQSWKELSKHLATNISKLELPQTVKTDLTAVAESMGCLMVEWLEIMSEESKSPIDLGDYLDHIHWTSVGNISTADTIHALYTSHKLPKTYYTFIKISNHCLEDCIVHFPLNSEEFIKMATKRHSKLLKVSVPLYWCYYLQNDIDGLISHLRTIPEGEDGPLYQDQLTIEENMFILSVHNLNFSASQFFWKKLDDQRKVRIIGELAEFSKCYYLRIYYRVTMDLMMFLWSQFCIYDVCDYSTVFFSVQGIRVRAANWPWTEVFGRALERAMNSQEPEDYQYYLDGLMMYLDTDEADNVHEKCEKLFRCLWQKCTPAVKKSLNFEEFFQTLRWRCAFGNFELLNYVVEDEEFGELERRRFLANFVDYLVEYDYFDDYSADAFFKGLTCKEEVKEWLKDLQVKKQEARRRVDALIG